MSSVLKYIFLILFLFFLLLPITVIIYLSFSSSRYLEFPAPHYTLRWYREMLESPKWLNAFGYSFKIAICTAIFSTFISLCFVLGIQNIKPKIKQLILSFVLVPLLIPSIIISISLFFWFAKFNMVASPVSLFLSHTLLTFPISVWLLSDTNDSIAQNLDDTAMTLGETPLNVFFKVRLPQMKTGLCISLLLSFIISFDEPVISLFVTGTENLTLPKVMWDGIRYEINPTLTAVSSFLIIFTLLLFFISRLIIRKPNNSQHT